MKHDPANTIAGNNNRPTSLSVALDRVTRRSSDNIGIGHIYIGIISYNVDRRASWRTVSNSTENETTKPMV